MSPDLEENKIINLDNLDELIQKPNVIVTDVKELGNKC